MPRKIGQVQLTSLSTDHAVASSVPSIFAIFLMFNFRDVLFRTSVARVIATIIQYSPHDQQGYTVIPLVKYWYQLPFIQLDLVRCQDNHGQPDSSTDYTKGRYVQQSVVHFQRTMHPPPHPKPTTR